MTAVEPESELSPRICYLCLGICPTWASGGAMRARQMLEAFKRLGLDVTVLSLAYYCKEWPDWVEAVPIRVKWDCWDMAGLYRAKKVRRDITQQIAEHLPDDTTPVLVETPAGQMCCPPHPRLIYSCNDVEAKLVPLRRKRSNRPVTLRTRMHWWATRWIERRIIRKATRVVAASASEAVLAGEIAGCEHHYIPTVEPTIGEIRPEQTLKAPACIFFGGPGATANRIMLDHLRDGLFDTLADAMPDVAFRQVGSLKNLEEDLTEWITSHFESLGFVDDLATALEFGAIGLIPYEHDTGFRTKIPEMCAYGLIPAGYRISFDCCSEMVDGVNCIMGDDGDDLAARIAEVAAADAKREALALAALETAREKFSPEALLPCFRKLLTF